MTTDARVTESIYQSKDSERITFVVKNGMMFFNCTQDAVDKEAENGSRRKAYSMIDEWEDIQ